MTAYEQTQTYVNYIEEHRENVRKAWKLLQNKCEHIRFIYDDYIYNCIDYLISTHDLSKYSEEEFTQYRDKFYPTNTNTKIKELYEERFQKAWKHHYRENPHHWEFWVDREAIEPYIEEIYTIEMLCDWIAMSMKFGSTARDYYENNKSKIILPEWKKNLIYEVFDCIY